MFMDIVNAFNSLFQNFFGFFNWFSTFIMNDWAGFFPPYVLSAISFFITVVLLLILLKVAGAVIRVIEAGVTYLMIG